MDLEPYVYWRCDKCDKPIESRLKYSNAYWVCGACWEALGGSR